MENDKWWKITRKLCITIIIYYNATQSFPFEIPFWFGLRYRPCLFNALRPRQNCRHFADDIFKIIIFEWKCINFLKISQKCVPKVRIINIPALVQIMAWHQRGDKSIPMMSLVTDAYICVTRPQWVDMYQIDRLKWSPNFLNYLYTCI